MQREKQYAKTVAKEYRGKGYEVVEQPSPEELPDFLKIYRPALLAKRGNEVVVVEVKSRASLAKSSDMWEMAQALRAKPGWRFDLALLGEEIPSIEAVYGKPLPVEDSLLRMDTAKRLLDSGYPEAAFVMAWASLEAVVRRFLLEEGVTLQKLDFEIALRQAVYNGIVSRDDYPELKRLFKFWNAITHGFTATEFNADAVKELLEITQRILDTEVTPLPA